MFSEDLTIPIRGDLLEMHYMTWTADRKAWFGALTSALCAAGCTAGNVRGTASCTAKGCAAGCEHSEERAGSENQITADQRSHPGSKLRVRSDVDANRGSADCVKSVLHNWSCP